MKTEKLNKIGKESVFLKEPTIEIKSDGSGMICQRQACFDSYMSPIIENVIFLFDNLEELESFLEEV